MMYIHKIEYSPARSVEIDWLDSIHHCCRLSDNVQDWHTLPTVGLIAMESTERHEHGLRLWETKVSAILAPTATPPPPACLYRLTDTCGNVYLLPPYRGALPLATTSTLYSEKASEPSRRLLTITSPAHYSKIIVL